MLGVEDPFPVLNIHHNPVWMILLSHDMEVAELCYQEQTLFRLQQASSSVNPSLWVIRVLTVEYQDFIFNSYFVFLC